MRETAEAETREDGNDVTSREDAAERNGGRGSMVRVAAWTAVTLATLAYLAFGNVSVVWYRYNAFTGRAIRQDESRGIVQVWTNWLNDLPDGTDAWLLDAVFVGAVAIVVAAVMWGSWLLLVAAGGPDQRTARARR